MRSALSVFAFGLCMSAANPANAQPLPETKVVLRVSRDFLRQLIGIKFKRDQPIDQNANGTSVSGAARAEGKFDVKLIKSDDESDFDLLVNGTVLTTIAANRRPVNVFAHGTATFHAKGRIVFDEKRFTARPIDVQASHRFCLDDIAPYRPGVAGALTRVIARPIARRGLRDGDREAENEIRTELAGAIEKETDKLLVVLNKIGPIVRKGEELLVSEGLLPEGALRIYRAATDEHLLFSVGRPDHRMPLLPELDSSERAPLELWIARKDEAKEKRLEFLKQYWKDVQPIVHAQIARRSPELAKELEKKLPEFLEQVRVVAKGDWHVVTFAPKLRELPVIEIP